MVQNNHFDIVHNYSTNYADLCQNDGMLDDAVISPGYFFCLLCNFSKDKSQNVLDSAWYSALTPS